MTASLRSRILERLDPCGAIRDPCHSRVLESALAQRLLEGVGVEPAIRDRLKGYLAAWRSAPDELDGLLARTALDKLPVTQEAETAAHLLEQVPDFTSARKRLMLDAILALFGTTPRAHPDPGTFNTTGLHPWAAVQVTSLKLIILQALGKEHLIRDADIALLLSTQRQMWVWEGNILIHLSVLHALAPLTGMRDVVADGIRKLLPHQRADGGFPFVSDTDTWSTATAGVALAATGAQPGHLYSLSEHLRSQQQPNGGWSVTDRAAVTDVDDISVTLEFLHAVGDRSYRPVMDQGFRSLCGVRGADGGFPTYVAGSPSEACMTAAAVNALSVRPARHRDMIVSGLDFLAARQHADGGFDPDWSASRLHTLFRVVLAGQAMTGSPPAARLMVDKALRVIQESQNSDGGWGHQDSHPSDALSTSYALIALTRQQDHRPAMRALGFLLDSRHPGGGITTIPDSIGPRPFIFTIPVLADIFALLALGHLEHRLEPEHDVIRRHRKDVSVA